MRKAFSYQLRPTADARMLRVFVGRYPIGFVIKELGGWRPDGGVMTDVRRTKDEAAVRLLNMKGYQIVDR